MVWQGQSSLSMLSSNEGCYRLHLFSFKWKKMVVEGVFKKRLDHFKMVAPNGGFKVKPNLCLVFDFSDLSSNLGTGSYRACTISGA